MWGRGEEVAIVAVPDILAGTCMSRFSDAASAFYVSTSAVCLKCCEELDYEKYNTLCKTRAERLCKVDLEKGRWRRTAKSVGQPDDVNLEAWGGICSVEGAFELPRNCEIRQVRSSEGS